MQICNNNIDGWKSTELGQHFLVSENGEIEAGFGGKFNGKKPDAAFNTARKTKGKSGESSTKQRDKPKDEVVTSTGMKKSEVKKIGVRL